ncbi:MAG: GTP-binding protein, partial [Candidatus Aminicenantes bacterium]|nr:GTP-binding protein [Candidatus Aminicenantes bacterium]
RHLKKLSLSSTNLQDISFLQELSNLTYVDLSDNQITDYSFLQGLSNLTSLDLVGNQITDISFLQGLSNLTYVDLSGNQITDYSFLQGLSNLTSLDLAGNQITDISPLTGLTNLKHINLWHNKIVELPEEILNLELDIDVDSDDIAIGRNGIFLLDNPIEKPPLEIVRKGREAIKAYFESLKKEKTLPLNEVKVLLVGDGGAGKTSLVKGLLGQEFDINESQTHGINIDTWAVKEAEKEIKVNIWDFGGQEI